MIKLFLALDTLLIVAPKRLFLLLFIGLMLATYPVAVYAQAEPLLIEDSKQGHIQALQQGTVQVIAYTGTAAAVANAFASGARLGRKMIVRISCSSDCHYLEGAAPTATVSNGSLLPVGVVEYIKVLVGNKLSFIQVSANGIANVTEMF